MAPTHALFDVDPYAITICRKGANGHRIFLKKEADAEDAITLPAEHVIFKDDGEWTTFYCVVAEPGWEENGGQGAEDVTDVWRDDDEIRKAAHRFARNRGYVNAMHGAMEEQGCRVVENAVALSDFEVDGHTIRKGSWYLAIEPSDEFKALVDAGEITGVSLEGTGLREQLDKSKLSARGRKQLSPGAFVFPKDRRYPIHDRAHAANALARASGKPEEAAVRKAVCSRYPDLPACKVQKASYEGADKCPNCGSKVAYERGRCPNCGARSPVHKDALTDEQLVAIVAKIKSSAYPSLERKPGKSNWVDRAGGLPKYIERIAKHLHYEQGYSISAAIAAAVSTVKRWARGGDNVSKSTQAKAQKAVEEWERKKRSVRKVYTGNDATSDDDGDPSLDETMVREEAEAEHGARGWYEALKQLFGIGKEDDDDEQLDEQETASLAELGTLGENDPAEEADDVDQETKDQITGISKTQAETTSALAALTDLVRDLTGKITERKKDDDEKDKPSTESVKKSLDDVIEAQGTIVEGIAKIARDVDTLAAGGSGQHDDAERKRVEKTDEPWYTGIL